MNRRPARTAGTRVAARAVRSSRPTSARCSRRTFYEPDFAEILRSDRQRNRVADGLVESVVRAVSEDGRLHRVRARVEVVTELVMDGREIFLRLIDAHLESEVVDRVDVPRARMTDHFTVTGFDEERSFPERRRQWLEAERCEETFADSESFRPALIFRRPKYRRSAKSFWRLPAGRPRRRRSTSPAPTGCRAGERVSDRRPAPDRRTGPAASRAHTRAATDTVAAAGPTGDRARCEKASGRHVVLRPPHRAGVGKPQLSCTLVRQLDESRVALLHRRRDRMPAFPHLAKPRRVSIVREDLGDLFDVETCLTRFPVWQYLPRPYVLSIVGDQLRELRASFSIGGSGHRQRVLEDRQLPTLVHGQRRRRRTERPAFAEASNGRHVRGVGACGHRLGVGRDVRVLHPPGLARFDCRAAVWCRSLRPETLRASSAEEAGLLR